MGVPRDEILTVSRFIATKFVANEFVAYTALTAAQKTAPLSPRAYTIASYALCGFANIASIGIQIGVLSALAPSRAKAIVRLAPSAMICGFVSGISFGQVLGVADACLPNSCRPCKLPVSQECLCKSPPSPPPSYLFNFSVRITRVTQSHLICSRFLQPKQRGVVCIIQEGLRQ